MNKNQVILKLVFGCLNCDEPIPFHIAAKNGIQLCSKKCLKEINKKGSHFDMEDVWKR